MVSICFKGNNFQLSNSIVCSIPGVIRKCEGVDFPLVLSPGAGVKELTQVTLSETGVTVGSGVTVSQLEEELQKIVDEMPGEIQYQRILYWHSLQNPWVNIEELHSQLILGHL